MVNIFEKNGRIEISTINYDELQEDKFFSKPKKFSLNSQTVKITEINGNNKFLERLPYSNVKNLLLVELEDGYDFKGKFNLICNKGEYFLVIEKFYLELVHELYNLVDEGYELAEIVSEFTSLIPPKIELFQYKELEEDGLTTHLKKSHINNILHYTDMEKETISQFISSIKTLRIRSLFKYKRDNINSPKNEFCILISEFSKSEFSNNFSVKQDKNSNIIIEDYGVLLPSKLNTSYTEKPILILVHGLASSCKIEKENYIEITKYLVPYFHVFVFDYLTINQPISVSGMLLAAKVKKLKEKYRNKKVYIIAHSMGGLVSRSAIEEHSAEVDYLIMAGTPNNGSLPGKLARLEKTTLFIANQCKIKFQDFYDLIYSNVKGLEDLSRKNSYIKKLNENKLFNPEKYYCIAGYAFPVGHIRILNRIKTDLVVSLHNMMLVNGRKIPNIKLGSWNHMNYFTKNFEKPLGEIINSLLMKKKV